MKKIVLVLILSLLMICIFAGCDLQNSEDNTLQYTQVEIKCNNIETAREEVMKVLNEHDVKTIKYSNSVNNSMTRIYVNEVETASKQFRISLYWAGGNMNEITINAGATKLYLGYYE